MEDNSRDSLRVEKATSDDEVESTTAEISEESTDYSSISTSSERNVNREGASEPSTSEDCAPKETPGYRNTELESGDDSDDCANTEFTTSLSPPRRRTFSDSDLPIDEIPQLRIDDSEAKNNDKKPISGHERNSENSMRIPTTWCDIYKMRSKTTQERRAINSDEEFAKLMGFCSEMTKLNSTLSSLSLKRSVSTPPVVSAKTRQRRKYRVCKLRNDRFKSEGKPDEWIRTKGESSETKSASESAHKKSLPISPEDIARKQSSKPYEVRTNNSSPENIERCSTNQAFSSDTKTETSSEMSRLIDLKEKPKFSLENALGIETSWILRKSEESGIAHVAPLNSSSEDISDLNTSHDMSVITGTEKLESPAQHDLGTEDAGSSESSEISRILEAGKTLSPAFMEYYSTTDTETTSSSDYSHTNSADIGKDKSPPEITAEPPSVDSGIFKVPSKVKDCSTSTDLPFPPKPKSLSAPSSTTRKRPTDFNVKTRSAFYVFNINSPTGLVLRPYRSLPNVNRPPRFNLISRSMDFSNLRSGVVRSLFTDDFNSSQPGSSSGSESVNKNKCSAGKEALIKLLEGRTKSKVSEKSPKNSDNDACSKANCPKITVTSSKETNENVTLQDSLSSELVGDFSEINLEDSLALPEVAPSTKTASPKRKATISPNSIECSPAKIPRTSSEFDPKEASVKEKKNEPLNTKDFLKPENESVKTKCSPKRKSEDVDSYAAGTSSSNAATQDESSKSAPKKAKIKPPTPEAEESDAPDCQPELDKKRDSEEEPDD